MSFLQTQSNSWQNVDALQRVTHGTNKPDSLKIFENTIGEYYDDMVKFFYGLNKMKVDYVICLSRRCMVIMQEMIKDFREEGLKIQTENLISDKSIYNYCIFSNKDIVIVDDIIIHGRAISQIYEQVKPYAKNVQVYAFFASQEARYNPITSFNYIHTGSMGELRALSNRIIDSIYENYIPYVSYIPVMYFTKIPNGVDNVTRIKNSLRSISDLEKKMSKYESVKYPQNGEQLRTQQNSKIYFISNKYTNYLGNISLGLFLRTYSGQEKAYAMPYLQLKDIPIEEFKVLLSNMGESLSYCNGIKKIFMMHDNAKPEDENLIYQYQARFLTFLLGYLCFKLTLCDGEKDTSENFISAFDEGTIEFNFKTHADSILKEIDLIDGKSVLQAIASMSFSQTEKLNDYYKSNTSGLQIDVWTKYLLSEENAKKRADREILCLINELIGSTSSSSREQMNNESIQNRVIQRIGEVFMLMDSGEATALYRVEEINEAKCISNILLPGEQAFKLSPFGRNINLSIIKAWIRCKTIAELEDALNTEIRFAIQEVLGKKENYSNSPILEAYIENLKDNYGDISIFPETSSLYHTERIITARECEIKPLSLMTFKDQITASYINFVHYLSDLRIGKKKSAEDKEGHTIFLSWSSNFKSPVLMPNCSKEFGDAIDMPLMNYKYYHFYASLIAHIDGCNISYYDKYTRYIRLAYCLNAHEFLELLRPIVMEDMTKKQRKFIEQILKGAKNLNEHLKTQEPNEPFLQAFNNFTELPLRKWVYFNCKLTVRSYDDPKNIAESGLNGNRNMVYERELMALLGYIKKSSDRLNNMIEVFLHSIRLRNKNSRARYLMKASDEMNRLKPLSFLTVNIKS